MKTERRQRADSILEKVKDRELRIFGKFARHKIQTHNGFVGENCDRCSELNTITNENLLLSLRLENIDDISLLKPLEGKKIMVIEDRAWLAEAEYLGEIFQFTLHGKTNFPKNLAAYVIENEIQGALIHLWGPHYMENQINNIVDAKNSGLKVAVIFPNYRIRKDEKTKYKNLLKQNKVPFVVKDYRTLFSKGLLLLADQFRD